MEWSEDYLVDQGPIDEQHQQLVEIMNKFDDANRRGKSSRAMKEILNDLMGYTQEHFAYEEKVMEEAGYDQLKQHQSEHRQLIQKLEKFQFEFDSKGKHVNAEMKNFLKHWLTSHIINSDRAYIPCLEKEKV